MELRQLEYFLACCDHGTFTAAARSLHVVQSAVSTSIARLEREVGARLFDRTATSLVLTEAGQAIVVPARTALRARAEVGDAVAALRGDIAGGVSLGALVNIGGAIDLAEAFAMVHRRHPGITIAMRQNPRGSAGNIRGIRDGSLDLALFGGNDDDIPGATVEWLAVEPLVLVCHPDHRLAKRGGFVVADLVDERVIDHPPGWGIRAVVDRYVPQRLSVIEVADQEFGTQLARRGFGVTLVPQSVARDQREVSVLTCRDREMFWHIGIAHSADLTPSSAACAVLEIVREVAGQDQANAVTKASDAAASSVRTQPSRPITPA